MIRRLSVGMSAMAALIFVTAGTWRYWQGWIFLAIGFTYAVSAFSYFYRHDPSLMERRLRSEEKISEQKRLSRLIKLVSLWVFLIPGLDNGLGWSRAL